MKLLWAPCAALLLASAAWAEQADRSSAPGRDKETLQALALQAQIELVETLSASDGLTGVVNQRHFREVLAVESIRAARLADAALFRAEGQGRTPVVLA